MEYNKHQNAVEAFERIVKYMCNVCGQCGFNTRGSKVTRNCRAKYDTKRVRQYLEEVERTKK